MPSKKLRECPFCGCNPHVDSMIFHDIGRIYYVSCESKRCTCNPCTNSRKSRADAVAAWNRRMEKGTDHA